MGGYIILHTQHTFYLFYFYWTDYSLPFLIQRTTLHKKAHTYTNVPLHQYLLYFLFHHTYTHLTSFTILSNTIFSHILSSFLTHPPPPPPIHFSSFIVPETAADLIQRSLQRAFDKPNSAFTTVNGVKGTSAKNRRCVLLYYTHSHTTSIS